MSNEDEEIHALAKIKKETESQFSYERFESLFSFVKWVVIGLVGAITWVVTMQINQNTLSARCDANKAHIEKVEQARDDLDQKFQTYSATNNLALQATTSMASNDEKRIEDIEHDLKVITPEVDTMWYMKEEHITNKDQPYTVPPSAVTQP